MNVWYCHGTLYLCLSSLPSCFSPRKSTESIMAAQIGGGCTCFNHVSSISKKHLRGSEQFASMLARVPLGISRRTPNIFHLSATWWQRPSSKSFSSGLLEVVEHSLDPEAAPIYHEIINNKTINTLTVLCYLLQGPGQYASSCVPWLHLRRPCTVVEPVSHTLPSTPPLVHIEGSTALP